MKLLITGGCGYIGSVLTRHLGKNHHEIVVLDKLLYGKGSLEKTRIIEEDLGETDLLKLFAEENFDAVIHLAAISKEPSGQVSNELVLKENYLNTKKLAEAAKTAKIKKFIFASSCSVYFTYSLPKLTEGNERWQLDKELPLKTEKDQINPISPYSVSKRAGEELLMNMADESFTPIILRQGTLYGLSPRMRFDLVINALTKGVFFDNKMTVLKNIYRPLLDIQTAVQAYEKALSLKKPEIINVADFNSSLEELAGRVSRALEASPEVAVKEVDIERNYRASTEKFHNYFLKYPLEKRPLERAIWEIYDFLKRNPEDKDIYYNQSKEGYKF